MNGAAELFPPIAAPLASRYCVTLEAKRWSLADEIRIVHETVDALSEAGAVREVIALRIGKAESKFWQIRIVEIRRVSP